MRTVQRVVSVLALAVLFGTSGAHAWDGERQGFILGAGIGAGHIVPEDGEGSTELNFLGRIGYALNNQMAFHLTTEGVFDAASDDSVDASVFASVTTSTLGISYYLKESAPSLYVGGGLGLATASVEFCIDDFCADESESGFGLRAHVGFEAIKHVNLEVGAHYGVIDDGSFFLLTGTIGGLGF